MGGVQSSPIALGPGGDPGRLVLGLPARGLRGLPLGDCCTVGGDGRVQPIEQMTNSYAVEDRIAVVAGAPGPAERAVER